MRGELVVCVDIGSTFTKAALVAVPDGRLVVTAEYPTTVDTDVMDGVDRCLDTLAAADPAARAAQLLACSSAGGGLRIAVVGNEELVTAEAGRRVALTSGGKVVHVAAGGVDRARLEASRPDVVLLVGGTDGGNREVVVGCAHALVDAGWRGPVVMAGNVAAQEEVAAVLGAAGTPYLLSDNVVPRIGVLAPDSARKAIRQLFLSHVIGGKHLSTRDDFAAVVRGATPDVVLTAVELLAAGIDDARPGVGDVVVVDVGGATTDVYSAVEPTEDERDDGLSREVVATSRVNRTVEGDLGMRWSAPSTLDEAVALGLTVGDEEARRQSAARQSEPAFLPVDHHGAAFDLELATLAAGVALRRHAGRAVVRFEPDQQGRNRLVERSGTDLRETALVVGSGGVLRHAPDAAAWLLDHARPVGGWQLPEHPEVVVDSRYVLAPAGLLAESAPEAAYRLLRTLAP